MTVLQPGQMLGPYQITSQVGKGGMATVYKAYQASMDRYVALKVVSGQIMDDPSFLQRFRQEARLIAKLEHPHILPVYDFGEADGIPYMVMRFLEAGTLTERLELGQLPLDEIDRIFTQLTDALEYAHENGVIHRDIKPSNAMLDKRGVVFLTDFGIAKMVEGTVGLTATGAITGTPSYMSPEQAQGIKVDQRSDVYSLGVVLFEMLTGRVPFEAETPMAVLFKQIQDPPPPLSLVRSDLPYTLETVLLKALTKKPEDRYPSMAAFRQGWKNALAEANGAVASVPAVLAPDSVASQPPVPQETSASAAKTVLTASPAVESTAPKKAGWKWLLSALPIVAIMMCLGLAFIFRGRLLQIYSRWRSGGEARVTQTANVTPANLPDGKTPFASGAGSTSWTATNSVYSIAFRGDEVLTAGFGGITVWKPDGTHTQITTANGLPNANTGVVFVGPADGLWVGSDAGIAHLQEKQTTTYTTDNGLDSNSIAAFAVRNKSLFAGTQYSAKDGGGLLAFNGETWQPVPGFPSSSSPDEKTVGCSVYQILNDPSDNLWVATDSGVAMLAAGQRWKVFKQSSGLPDDRVYTVYADRSGTIWAGTANGGAARFNPEKQVFESFANLKERGVYDVYSILEDHDGSLWFTGDNLARYTPDGKKWTSFNTSDGSLPFSSLDAAGMDPQGVLYFGSTTSGLLRYTGEKFEKLQVLNGLHYGEYGSIVPASDGRLIFVQLYGNGADQFDPASGSWTKVPPQDGYQPVPRAFDSKGHLWSGGSDGLWIFDGEKPVHLTTAEGLPANQINAIVFGADGTAYLATSAGIAAFDGKAVKEVYTVAKNKLISDNIFTLFIASDGSLWAGQDNGFSRRLPDGTWKSFSADSLFHSYSQYFADFVEDKTGTIWVTTAGDGLYSFAKDKWTRMLSADPGVELPSNYLTAAAIAPDGALWIGSNGQGVVRYDGKTWKRYGIKEGLLQLNINDIYIEPGGAVWVASNGGITRLQP